MKPLELVRRIAIPALVLLLVILGLRLWQAGPSLAPAPATPTAAVLEPQATPTPLLSVPPEPTAIPSPSPSLAPPVLAIRLSIPRLGIDLPVIEGDGVDVPYGKAAHHPDTAWPGQRGNAYLYGHARRGSMLELWGAKVGDQVALELADGRSLLYEVSEVLPRVRYDAVHYLNPSLDERLTLQTCTGANPADPRFIVIARPKG